MESRKPFTVQHRVGRVIEARIFDLPTVQHVNAYVKAFSPTLLAGLVDPVLCADHRPARIYPQKVADALTELFRDMNARWARVAIVVAPTNATLAMQLQRMVRESENDSRRVFFDADEAAAYLGEILTPADSQRVADFLAEPVES